MESASVVVWAGLDRALHADGSGCLAGVEEGGMLSPTSDLCHSARIECGLDAIVFWLPPDWDGLGGDCLSLDGHLGDAAELLEGSNCGRLDVRALFDLGFICHGAELYPLEFKSRLIMAIHTLHTKQIIKASRESAWEFFSNPRNLSRITPPSMGFEIKTADLPARVYAGMMIAYRVRPVLNIPMTWLTEITLVEEGKRFIDEQRIGPYAVWHHEHDFHDLGDGRIEMEDRITYALPFAPLGDLAHGFLVRPQLQRIFAFRERAVRELFPG